MTTNKLNKVLCVNDNEITLFILKRTLSKANFSEKVIERSDGREALSYCEYLIKNEKDIYNNYPRLIFLDLHMPVMDGWEFLDQFSNKIWPYFKETKVIITSQSVDLSETDRAKEYPFVIDFLKTQITVEYLISLRDDILQDYILQG
jgi:CheY-like chemotaxis protein